MLTYMNFWLCANLGQPQRGATLIEYVLIIAVIALVIFAAGSLGLTDSISNLFDRAASTVDGAGT